MKIAAVDTAWVDLPLPRRAGTAIHSIDSVGCLLVTVRTDEGVSGESLLFTINGARLGASDAMVSGLGELAVGCDPHDTAGIWQSMWMEVNATGHKGVTIAAMSALDVACWDIVGRSVDLPLHKLFGGGRDSVDTYASSGLWLSASIDELQDEAAAFVGQGFTAIKMRIGSDRPADDVERVRAVRAAIGADTRLLVDANQRFTPKEAIRIGRRLGEFDIAWFEEPVATHDLQGSADVRSALDITIASGETEYTRYGMKALLDARACDVLMPDLQRVGGYTEFRRAAALAAAYDVPVSTHFFTEHSLAIAGSTPGCISVEHVDWFAPLFNEAVELRDGRVVLPDRPGTGFTFA